MSNDLSYKIKADGSLAQSETAKTALEIAKLKKLTDNANRSLNEFDKNSKNLKGSLNGMFSSLKSGDLQGFASSARNAASSLKELSTSGFGNLAKAIGTSLGPLGIVAASIASIGTVCGISIKNVQEFDNSLRKLKDANPRLDTSSLQEYGDFALDLSNRSTLTVHDTIKAMLLLAENVPDLSQQADGFEYVILKIQDLDDACDDLSIDQAVSVVSDAMNNLGMLAKNSDKFVNALGEVADNTAGNIVSLANNFLKVSSAAGRSNLSFEEVLASLGVLSGKIDDALIGTGFSQMLDKMEKSVNDKFKPSIVGLEEALKNIEAANLSAKEKMELFGKSGYYVADALLKETAQLSDLQLKMEGSTSTTDKAARANDNLASKIQYLKNATSNLFTIIGQSKVILSMISFFGKLIDYVREGIVWFQDLSHEMQQMEGFDVIFEIISDAVHTLGTACKNVFSAIGVVVKTAVYTFDLLFTAVKRIREYLNKFFTDNSFYRGFISMIDKIKEYWNKFLNNMLAGYNKVRQFFGLNPIEIKTKTDEDIKKGAENAVTTKKTGTIITNNDDDSKKTGSKGKEIIDNNSLNTTSKILSEIKDFLNNTAFPPTSKDVDRLKNFLKELNKTYKNSNIDFSFGITGNESAAEQIKKVTAQYLVLQKTIERAGLEQELAVFEEDNFKNSVDGGKRFIEVLKEEEKRIKKLTDQKWFIDMIIKDQDKGNGFLSLFYDRKIQDLEQKVKFTAEADPDYELFVTQLKNLKKEKAEIDFKINLDTSGMDENSLSYLNTEIQEYLRIINISSVDSPEWVKAKEKLDELTQKQQLIQLKIDIKDLNSSDIDKLIEIQKLTKEKQKIQYKIEIQGLEKLNDGSLGSIQDLLSKKENLLKITAQGTPEYTKLVNEIRELKAEELKVQIQFDIDTSTLDELKEKVHEGTMSMIEDSLSVTEGFWNMGSQLTDTISSINQNWDDMSGWEKAKASIDLVFLSLNAFVGLVKGIETMTKMFKTLGTTMKAQAAISTAASAQSASAASTEMVADGGAAVAGATKSGASLPYPANLIAIGTGVAAVIAAIAMISSLKFAQGGIVPGGNYMGDHVFAQVNSGEMILNRNQLNRLWNFISSSQKQPVYQRNSSGNVEFTIRGEDLVGVINNYNDIESHY